MLSRQAMKIKFPSVRWNSEVCTGKIACHLESNEGISKVTNKFYRIKFYCTEHLSGVEVKPVVPGFRSHFANTRNSYLVTIIPFPVYDGDHSTKWGIRTSGPEHPSFEPKLLFFAVAIASQVFLNIIMPSVSRHPRKGTWHSLFSLCFFIFLVNKSCRFQ